MLLSTYFGLRVALLTALAAAWFPGKEKDIFALDGQNLFNLTNTNTTGKRRLPASGMIRGVNMGSLFVFEKWLVNDEVCWL